MRTQRDPVVRLMVVNREIAQREEELEALYIERDQLSWMLDEGDHSE